MAFGTYEKKMKNFSIGDWVERERRNTRLARL